MKTSTKNVIITGCFSIVSALIGAGVMNEIIDGKTNSEISKVNVGDTYQALLSQNEILAEENQDLKDEMKKYSSLTAEKDSLKEENKRLKDDLAEASSLSGEYSSLVEENENLKNEMLKYSALEAKCDSLVEENEKLKESISFLQSNAMEEEYISTQGSDLDNDISSEEGPHSVSIFDMDTFKGIAGWYDASHATLTSKDFIDTYGNEYLGARIGSHGITKKDSKTTRVYLLDGKYSTCEGEFAWSKSCKDRSGSIWIEFYSGDELIYKTEEITADDRALKFSFSVEGIEKLTIVRTANVNSVKAIYAYLNLIE